MNVYKVDLLLLLVCKRSVCQSLSESLSAWMAAAAAAAAKVVFGVTVGVGVLGAESVVDAAFATGRVEGVDGLFLQSSNLCRTHLPLPSLWFLYQ